MSGKMILETRRLLVREFSLDDDAFIFRLMTDPSWIQFIGDRGFTEVADARSYLAGKLIPAYVDFGFGFYLVAEKHKETPLGICGFVKRDFLEHADLGFAFLPEFWRQGFAFESAEACLSHGRQVLGFDEVLAITSINNEASGQLLRKLGFERAGTIQEDDDDEELFLYSSRP